MTVKYNEEVFEKISGYDFDEKVSKIKMYRKFLLETKLKLPNNLTKESKLIYKLVYSFNLII